MLTHSNLIVDIKDGAFSEDVALEAADFQRPPSYGAAGKFNILTPTIYPIVIDIRCVPIHQPGWGNPIPVEVCAG